MGKKPVLDTSFVTKNDEQYTRGIVANHGGWKGGDVGLAFTEADDKLGYPEGTMASYFGKISGAVRKEKAAKKAAAAKKLGKISGLLFPDE